MTPSLNEDAAHSRRTSFCKRDVVQFEGVPRGGGVKGGNAATAPGLHHVEQRQQLGQASGEQPVWRR
jgi:hypothetical protein